MTLLPAIMISLFITMALVPILRQGAYRLNVLDLPDERKRHAMPTPKTGGLAMAVGMVVPALLWLPGDKSLLALLAACAVIVIFGVLDDVYDLNFKIKFGAQILASLIVVLSGAVEITSLGTLLPEEVVLPFWVAAPLTVLTIVGVTNAINLSDGLDGLAGGISLLSFLTLGLLAYQAEQTEVALIAAAICGAIFGFLRFNTYPAQVFMGDTGSQLLGFLGITLALRLTQTVEVYSPLLPILLLGLPVFDTVRVIRERWQKGLSPFAADRNHLHHKLMGFGCSHPEAVFIIYLFQTALVGGSYLLRFHSDWILLLAYGGFVAAILSLFALARSENPVTLRLATAAHRLFLRRFPSREQMIRIVFPALKIGFPATLMFLVFQATHFSQWMGGILLAAGTLCGLLIYSAPALKGLLVRLGLYLLSPMLVLQTEQAMADGALPNDLLFGLLVLLCFLVARFTRRRGFRSTPLDFLILLIAVGGPLFPVIEMEGVRMSMVAAKTLTLFYAFEVLMNELREKSPLPLASVGVMSAAVVAKSLLI